MNFFKQRVVNSAVKTIDKQLNLSESELTFKSSRSGGPGGQSVNKLETKVTLYWDVKNSTHFDEEDLQTILLKLKNKINDQGIMMLYHQTERSQLANKVKVVEKWKDLIKKALYKPKKRKKTKPSKESIMKGKQRNAQRAEVKKMRRKIDLNRL